MSVRWGAVWVDAGGPCGVWAPEPTLADQEVMSRGAFTYASLWTANPAASGGVLSEGKRGFKKGFAFCIGIFESPIKS